MFERMLTCSAKNLLITGHPGVGKTTFIKSLCEMLKLLNPIGFYTDEIRHEGVRKGFELVSLDGRKEILSHCDFSSPYRVGRYGVNIAGFDDFLTGLDLTGSLSKLICIDEIGKMECLSNNFVELVRRLLDSNKTVIATVASKGGGIILESKYRKDVNLIKITRTNRNSLYSEVRDLLQGILDPGDLLHLF